MDEYFQYLINQNEIEYKHEINQYAMAISKVKSVQANGTWDSEYGTLFKFEYEMQDGAIVNANHKTNTPFPVGTEVEYEITKPEYSQGKVKKPQPVQQGSNNSGGKQFKADPAKQNSIEAQVALKSAIEFHAAFGFNDDFASSDSNTDQGKVRATADIFYEWLKSKS